MVLIARNLCRSYVQGDETLDILKNVDIQLNKGEMVALLGPSGSGKSTLLHTIGLLEKPQSGTIIVDGVSCDALNDTERSFIRGQKIGFIYQFHHLLPDFNACENVMMPALMAGMPRQKAQQRAEALLKQVGMDHRLKHRPGQLSGGEQQRVAIARAMMNRPALLLADEPTGNLDPQKSTEVFDLFIHLVQSEGTAALIATHNHELAKKMNRMVVLRDKTVHDTTLHNLEDPA